MPNADAIALTSEKIFKNILTLQKKYADIYSDSKNICTIKSKMLIVVSL
ncbi:MAG: hypothetical protein WBB28_20170 [Crinalium sp.]